MTITKFNHPNHSFPSFIDGFFKDFPSEKEKTFRPAVNIFENAESFFIEVVAPGRNKEDFKIQLEKNSLSISAEQKEENNEGNTFTHREFNLRSLKRSFKLPEDVNKKKISASYDNGILTLSLPKKEEKKDKGPVEINIS